MRVDSNIAEIQKMLKDINQKGVRKAMSRSINQAASETVKYSARLLSKEEKIKLSAKFVKRRVKIDRVKADTLVQFMSAKVHWDGFSLPIVFFKPKEKRIMTAMGERFGVTAIFNAKRVLTGGFHLKAVGGKLQGGAHEAFDSTSVVVKRDGDALKAIKRPSMASLIRKRHLDNELKRYAANRVIQNFKKNFPYYVKGIREKMIKGAGRPDHWNAK